MEQSSNFILRELLAVSCFFAAVIFALISLSKDGREHFLRVCALFLVGVVALFANNPYTYFASVFIVATAVTQLDFLQNLAAIMRGSKEYFDYQKESRSKRDVESKIEREMLEEEVAIAVDKPKSQGSNDLALNPRAGAVSLMLSPKAIDYRSFGTVAHEYALNWLEGEYGRVIDRYPRFKNKGGRVTEFDGVLEADSKLTVFEVKISLREVVAFRLHFDALYGLVRDALELAKSKKKSVEVKLIYVVFDEYLERGKKRLLRLEEELQAEYGKNHFNIQFLTYAQIGLGDFAEEVIAARDGNRISRAASNATPD